jgi:hypothetical protein
VPQAYLKRHGLSRRGELNTIANRTLISDETNNKIKDKAPASYVYDKTIFPNGLSIEILAPHFIDSDALASVNESPSRARTRMLQIFTSDSFVPVSSPSSRRFAESARSRLPRHRRCVGLR